MFHGYKVMGSLEVSHQAIIKTIWKDLESRVFSEHGYRYTMCFDPHHRIRAYHGEEFKDYLICFHCHHLYVYDTADGEHKRTGLAGENVNRL
jgi:hypothetical protein